MSRFSLLKAWKSKNDDLNAEFLNIRQIWNRHNDGAVSWDNLSANNSALALRTTTQTANYTATLNDSLLLIDTTSSALTLTLPTAVGMNGKQYIIINTGTKMLTVATTSSQTINGATPFYVPTQYFNVTLFSDGSNWLAI